MKFDIATFIKESNAIEGYSNPAQHFEGSPYFDDHCFLSGKKGRI